MKYVGFFDISSEHRKRSVYPASRDKMIYIANRISKYTHVEIISASGVCGKHSEKACVEKITDKISLKLFYSLGKKVLLLGIIGSAITIIQLFFYLLIYTKRDEKIIVYHSLGYMFFISLARKIKKFYLILEIEEIYSDVTGDTWMRNRELQFFQSADAYLFPTQLLDSLVNIKRKPSIIIHGTYQIEEDRKFDNISEISKMFDEHMIHCVYAGTLDSRKGGAIAAASSAQYLPENYHVHILGFGSEKDIRIIKDQIADISEKSKARVSYDGVVSGEDYIRYLQNCDIGLSTQNPDGKYNDTSFPSKVLSYLANGLRVVSICIPVVEQSAVGDILYYYDKQTPEKIAEAILSVDLYAPYDSKERIKKLDIKFTNEIYKILIDEEEENN